MFLNLNSLTEINNFTVYVKTDFTKNYVVTLPQCDNNIN